jgi:hypothetical protein
LLRILKERILISVFDQHKVISPALDASVVSRAKKKPLEKVEYNIIRRLAQAPRFSIII